MSSSPTPAKRQVVRKYTPDPIADFDEQWWPVTLLLLVVAACLAGSIYYNDKSDFTTPVWYRNAWVQIGSIGVTTLLLIIGVLALRGDSQRRLQLGIFLSLLLHASLLYWARNHYLVVVGKPPEPELNLVESVPVTIPDYIADQDRTNPLADLTKPAETKITEEAKTELTPKTPEQMKAEKKTTEQPEQPRDKQPTPIELARIDPTAPQKNKVLEDETLQRRIVEQKVRTESVKTLKLDSEKEVDQTPAAQALDTARREAATEPTRRLNTSDPRTMQQFRPVVAPTTSPERVTTPDRTAAADNAAARSRLPTPAPLTPMQDAASAAVEAQPSQQTPVDAPRSTSQNVARQSAAASAGAVAPFESPAITFSQGSAAPQQLVRSVAPESSDSVAMATPTNRPQRVSAGGAVAGASQVVVNEPTAPSTVSPGAAGGASLDASLTTTTRGDFGTPQAATGAAMALPTPVGQGSGSTVGSTSIGSLRRSDAAGDGTAGEAAAAAVVGRPGRGRAVGPSTAASNQYGGGALAAVVGPAVSTGNATTGAASGNAPAVSGTGSSLGQRTVMQTGEGLRPSTLGGTTGTGNQPSAGAGMLASGGGATTGIPGGTGIGGAAGSPGGSGGPLGSGGGGPAAGSGSTSRRELGELAGSASGSAAASSAGGRRARMDNSDLLRDRHGNLKGSANDLIVDGQMAGEKIAIITFYVDKEIDESPLIGALAAKGYAVDRMTASLPPVNDFAQRLDGAKQLWLISSETNRLPAAHLRVILDRWRAGRLALCLMADNAPFTAEAVSVLNAIAPGSTITGDYLGEQKLHARVDNGVGFDPKLPLFHNVETLFEGTTISSINSRYLTPVCYASNGLPLIGIYQPQGASRLLVHCGFTSLYERFWDDAGVSRFAVNVAGWLSEADKKPSPTRNMVPVPR